ncbi:hypothetical protein TgHK011_006735 [Trichoderma gracile]|nr:hypothetical protein TgHK011_006735 [Trichoderma gracile]
MMQLQEAGDSKSLMPPEAGVTLHCRMQVAPIRGCIELQLVLHNAALARPNAVADLSLVFAQKRGEATHACRPRPKYMYGVQHTHDSCERLAGRGRRPQACSCFGRLLRSGCVSIQGFRATQSSHATPTVPGTAQSRSGTRSMCWTCRPAFLLTDNEALDTLLWNAAQDAVKSSCQDECFDLTPDSPLTWDNDIAGFNPPMNLNNTNHSETASPMSRADSLGLTDFSLSPDSLDTPIYDLSVDEAIDYSATDEERLHSTIQTIQQIDGATHSFTEIPNELTTHDAMIGHLDGMTLAHVPGGAAAGSEPMPFDPSTGSPDEEMEDSPNSGLQGASHDLDPDGNSKPGYKWCCKRWRKNDGNFKKHLRRHDPQLRCEAKHPRGKTCSESFADDKDRDRHYWVYHKEFAKERNIPRTDGLCEHCKKTFSRKDNRKRHLDRFPVCRAAVERM